MSLVKASLNFTKTNNDIAKVNDNIAKDECRYCESKRKVMSELCEFTKTQASEACQHEQTILNGVEAMGNNIAKVINSEIQAMSTRVDVLNQASLDTIMNKLNTSRVDMLNQASLDTIINKLNTSSYMKETSRPCTANYTMPSKSLSTPNPKPEPS
jgi:hypothetical protein